MDYIVVGPKSKKNMETIVFICNCDGIHTYEGVTRIIIDVLAKFLTNF